MAYLKALLGLFSFVSKFAWLAKFAWLGKIAAFIPGGQIVAAVGGVFNVVASFCKWVLADIVDAFKEPQRLVVRTICFVIVLLIGVHQGIRWDKAKVDEARFELATLKKDLREKDNDDARKAAAAAAERDKAERAALAAPAAAAPAGVPAAAGLRKPRASRRKPEPGLFSGLSAVFGTGK